jgi:hypothetical protein
MFFPRSWLPYKSDQTKQQQPNTMNGIQTLLAALTLTLPLPGASAFTTNKVAVTADMLSASSVYDGYTPFTAFDGIMDQNTGWTAVGGQKQAWLAVDFGAVKQIAYVRVFPDRYIATDPSYSYLDRYRVDVWSNATWQAMTPLISTPTETWYPADVNFSTSKLRFWCESDGNGPQVKEIEIYEVQPFRTLSLTPGSGGNLQFTWFADAGLKNQLQSNTNLPTTNWLNEGAPFISAGGLTSTNLPSGPEPKKFYRLQISQ